MSVLTLPALKAEIDLYIKTNGVKAITGALLNVILNDVVDSLQDYTDDEIAALTSVLTGYLPLAGGVMSGDINLNDVAKIKTITAGGSGFLAIYLGNIFLGYNENSQHSLRIFNETNPQTIPNNGNDNYFIIRDDNTKGLIYEGDYSANFTPESLITKRFLESSIAALVDSSPATLDTLNELAAALGDDPNFATTVTNAIAAKLPLSGGVMSGSIELNGNSVKNNTGAVLLESGAGLFNLKSLLSTFIGVLNVSLLTANRTITIQDKDYTVAGLDDIKNITVDINTTATSHTGNTTETKIGYLTLEKELFNANDKMYIEFLGSAIGLNGSKTIRFYLNTAPDLSGTKVLLFNYVTNNLCYALERTFWVRNATTILNKATPTNNLSTDNGSSNNTISTITTNFGVKMYLVCSVELASAADLFQYEGLSLERIRK